MHHSFDIRLATKYGIDAAIIIHHFQHWIGINKRMGKNLHDGRTWTYQTQKYMLANFPYFKNRQHLIRIIDKLVEDGVLIKKNFNKTAFDRTVWYAFSDESTWISGVEFDSELKEDLPLSENGQCIVQKCTIDCREPDNGVSGTGQPIPDTKPDTKPKKELRPPSAPPAIAVDIANFLFNSIKKFKHNFKPPNIQSWAKEIDLMMRRDKIDEERIRQVIEWLPSNEFWRKNVMSAEKLRLQFERLEVEMASVKEASCVEINKKYVEEVKKYYLKKFKDDFLELVYIKGGVKNKDNQKDVFFDMHPQSFQETFDHIFGVKNAK